MVTARLFVAHLRSFVLPLATLVYFAFAPAAPIVALAWVLFVVASCAADVASPADREPPPEGVPMWPFDLQIVALSAIQLANVGLLVRLVAGHPVVSVATAVAVLLVGISSGYSAIVVAHELVHRASPWQRNLGRLLLVSTLYEHFATEHVRGHHKRVGTPEDPATARFGETFVAFYLRTVPAQLRSAWALESKRVDGRMWRHRVLQGLVAEVALLAAIGVFGGALAAAAFAAQAWIGVLLLEAVNYMEHWGLVRQERRVRPVDSWDAESAFTRFTLVGLSRHADHHANAARPYPTLRLHEESPKLPYGYFGSVLMVLFRNGALRERMTAELQRKQLGPFAPAKA